MTEWYEATTTKEIYWKGQTYRNGEKVKIIKEDVIILSDAGVIGAIKKINIQTEKEFAVRSSPENQKINHKRGRKLKHINKNSVPG